jgi:hypothetical protein
MKTTMQRLAFGLSFVFSTTIAAVFLFLATALVPYWQDMSGAEVQSWFAGPFTRFSTMMVPTHFLSIATLALAVFLHRKTGQLPWLVFAFAALLVCQGFNFTLYGAVLNPALQSQNLPAEEALATLDRWAVFHIIRSAAICLCVVSLFAVMLKRAP